MSDLDDAYAELDAAIKHVCELEAEGPAVLVDWVVLAASQFFDENEGWSRVQSLIDPRSNTPFYRVLGLLEFATNRARAEALRDDD